MPVKMKQLSFLGQKDNETSLNIKVSLLKDGVWTAAINNGWWVARGNSQKHAVEKVVEAFMREY